MLKAGRMPGMPGRDMPGRIGMGGVMICCGGEGGGGGGGGGSAARAAAAALLAAAEAISAWVAAALDIALRGAGTASAAGFSVDLVEGLDEVTVAFRGTRAGRCPAVGLLVRAAAGTSRAAGLSAAAPALFVLVFTGDAPAAAALAGVGFTGEGLAGCTLPGFGTAKPVSGFDEACFGGAGRLADVFAATCWSPATGGLSGVALVAGLPSGIALAPPMVGLTLPNGSTLTGALALLRCALGMGQTSRSDGSLKGRRMAGPRRLHRGRPRSTSRVDHRRTPPTMRCWAATIRPAGTRKAQPVDSCCKSGGLSTKMLHRHPPRPVIFATRVSPNRHRTVIVAR